MNIFRLTSANADRIIFDIKGSGSSIGFLLDRIRLQTGIPTAGNQTGETNTASNVGDSGTGLFKQKVGTDLEFYKLNAGAGTVIDVNTGTGSLDISIGTIDHTTLSNIGVNTHAQIDTHIADSTIHFTEASIDHNNILNNGTNTHAQIDDHIADTSIHFTETSIDHDNILNNGTNTHAQIDSHIADLTIHRSINDSSTSTTDLWSGSKINTEITNHTGDLSIHFTEASIDHANILNVGTYTHDQIDTHINDSTIHFTEGSIDHANILNVGTNTHAQIDNHIANENNVHGVTGNVVGTTDTQTLTNKTLTTPIIAQISNTGTLTLPTSTDTLVGRDTTDTLTNKTLTSPVISTIVNSGTLTLPTSTDTLVGRDTTDTLTNKTLTTPTIASILNGGTLTLPTSTDTLVGRATSDTLTNKSFGDVVNFNDVTQSTATNNGSLIIDGGVGIAKNLNVGGTSTFKNATFDDVTVGGLLIGSGTSSFSFPTENGEPNQLMIASTSGGITFVDLSDILTTNEISATTTTSTTSTSYVTINSMTSTPVQAGNYVVFFSAYGKGGSSNQDLIFAIHKNGTIISHSERELGIDVLNNNRNVRRNLHTQAIVFLNGTDTVDVRFKTDKNAFTVYQRSMILLKI